MRTILLAITICLATACATDEADDTNEDVVESEANDDSPWADPADAATLPELVPTNKAMCARYPILCDIAKYEHSLTP